ncbi:MAG: hypothetical protein AAGD43_17605 [Pseudomonadota bacterium]
MIAGSNDSILLVGGAVVVIVGLLAGYLLTRPKAGKAAAPKDPVEAQGAADTHPACKLAEHLAVDSPPSASEAREDPRSHSYSPPMVEEPEVDNEGAPIELAPAMLDLDPQLKHRIVYRFMPHLKGMLFDGDTLDGYLADAAARATHRGWSNDELLAAARTAKWKRPRASNQ